MSNTFKQRRRGRTINLNRNARCRASRDSGDRLAIDTGGGCDVGDLSGVVGDALSDSVRESARGSDGAKENVDQGVSTLLSEANA